MQFALGVNSPVYGSLARLGSPVLDGNLRFFGGMGLGLGLLLLWILPRIERETDLYRAFWFCAFVGGLGRLISIAVVGSPPALFVGITALEVGGAPVFIYWQHRVAVASVRSGEGR